MSWSGKGSGTAEDTREVESSPSFRMGFFVTDIGRIKMEQLVCPRCGEPIGSRAGIRTSVQACPEKAISGQCSCGEKYFVRRSLYAVILCFPERHVSLAL